MKEALGLATTADPVIDPIMTRSVHWRSAWQFVHRVPAEAPEDPVRFSDDNVCDIRAIRLPVYPAQLVSFVIEDVEVPYDQYRFDGRIGTVTSFYVPKLRIKLPDRLPSGVRRRSVPGAGRPTGRHQNIALGIYARGGNLSRPAHLVR